jgi:hypothetical protein
MSNTELNCGGSPGVEKPLAKNATLPTAQAFAPQADPLKGLRGWQEDERGYRDYTGSCERLVLRPERYHASKHIHLCVRAGVVVLRAEPARRRWSARCATRQRPLRAVTGSKRGSGRAVPRLGASSVSALSERQGQIVQLSHLCAPNPRPFREGARLVQDPRRWCDLAARTWRRSGWVAELCVDGDLGACSGSRRRQHADHILARKAGS